MDDQRCVSGESCLTCRASNMSGIQPVKNGCCNACTCALANASEQNIAATYLFRCKPSGALIHQQPTDKVPAARRSALQQLLPRFGWIFVELKFAPVGEVGALLDIGSVSSQLKCRDDTLTGQISSSGVPSVVKMDWISVRSLPTGPASNSGLWSGTTASATTQPAAHKSNAVP